VNILQSVFQNFAEGLNGNITPSQTDLKRPMGLYFNLIQLFEGTFSPSTYISPATAYMTGVPFILPVVGVNVANFAMGIKYSATKGGSGTGYSGALNLFLLPVNIDSTIDNTQGSEWAVDQSFPVANGLSISEDYTNTINSNSLPNPFRFSNYSASGPQIAGPFQWGFYFSGLTNTQVGDTFEILEARLTINGTGVVSS
jgi:hypothetical protein